MNENASDISELQQGASPTLMAVRSGDLLDDDTLRNLLDAAQKVKIKPAPPNPKDVAMEMYEVIGTLWEKGMTRKQMLGWLKRRGYVFKEYHVSLALRHYHDTRPPNPPPY